MVRLLHVLNYLNVNDPFTADDVMEIFAEIEDIYELFGLDSEPDQEPYINIGVQKRSWNNRVDVYILVGLKVRPSVNPNINNTMIENWDNWFCKPVEPESDGEGGVMEVEKHTLYLDEFNVHIIQKDERQVSWLEKIIEDMEDNTTTSVLIEDIINE